MELKKNEFQGELEKQREQLDKIQSSHSFQLESVNRLHQDEKARPALFPSPFSSEPHFLPGQILGVEHVIRWSLSQVVPAPPSSGLPLSPPWTCETFAGVIVWKIQKNQGSRPGLFLLCSFFPYLLITCYARCFFLTRINAYGFKYHMHGRRCKSLDKY